MPDINRKYVFSDEETLLIFWLQLESAFTFRDWSDNILAELRRNIRNFYRHEQGGKCAYCQQNISVQSVNNCHIEHIVAKSMYPSFMFESKNLCVICADCNEIKRMQESLDEEIDTVVKGDARVQYPKSANAFKIVQPHFESFDEHIEILANYFYVDKTKKGNFTIGACNLNRRLYKFGWEREIIDESEILAVATRLVNEGNPLRRADLINQLKHKLINT